MEFFLGEYPELPPALIEELKHMITEYDPRHNTENGYQAGCRQECCRVAHRLYAAERKRARIAAGIPDVIHGTANGYTNWDCRCDRCQVAALKAKHRQKSKRG